MLAKLVERAGIDQLQEHCDTHMIISPEQHGGRKLHSTTSCLIELQEEFLQAKDKGLKCALMAIDLSAAYDLCCHNTLDQQIRLTGADNLVRKWTNSFLSQRKQMVEINGTLSDTTDSLNLGLCQGSRSSGTLFAIYTNELPKAAMGAIEKSPEANTHQHNEKEPENRSVENGEKDKGLTKKQKRTKKLKKRRKSEEIILAANNL